MEDSSNLEMECGDRNKKDKDEQEGAVYNYITKCVRN